MTNTLAYRAAESVTSVKILVTVVKSFAESAPEAEMAIDHSWIMLGLYQKSAFALSCNMEPEGAATFRIMTLSRTTFNLTNVRIVKLSFTQSNDIQPHNI